MVFAIGDSVAESASLYNWKCSGLDSGCLTPLAVSMSLAAGLVYSLKLSSLGGVSTLTLIELE